MTRNTGLKKKTSSYKVTKSYRVADVYFLQEITIRGKKSLLEVALNLLRLIFNMVQNGNTLTTKVGQHSAGS
jgi:hypothetical protein